LAIDMALLASLRRQILFLSHVVSTIVLPCDCKKVYLMNVFRRSLQQILLTGFTLLLVACVPLQSTSHGTVPAGTIPNESTDAVDQAVTILTWQGAPLDGSAPCVELHIDAVGQTQFGPCGQAEQQTTLGETHQSELDALQRRLAPFTLETPTGTLSFNGFGTSGSPAWERAVNAWAQVVYSEVAAGQVSATTPVVMHWQLGADAEEATICNQITVLAYGYVYANQLPCAGGDVLTTTGGWLNDTQLAQLDYWLTALAPVETAAGDLASQGSTAATPAAERAMEAWAELVYTEVNSGRVSGAGATVMSWFIPNPAGIGELCQHLTVLSFGYAEAEIVPCAGGTTVQSTGGPLTAAELEQLDTWLYERAALYVENNYLAGSGTTPVTVAESSAIDSWAATLYARLTATAETAGSDFDLTTWRGFESDSGFVIYYPPTLYTVEVLPSNESSPFSGAIVLTPTATLNERSPLASSYTLSILAHGANKRYSLFEPVGLLANGRLLSYSPELLADHPITRTHLVDAPAVRVDELAAGPAGVTTQLTAIRADIVYELVVTPAQVTNTSDAAADQANRALVEQMIQTLRFTR